MYSNIKNLVIDLRIDKIRQDMQAKARLKKKAMLGALLGAFVVLQIADVTTTQKVLAAGGWEANPIGVWAMTSFGAWWPIPKIALMLACAALMLRWPARYVAPAVALMAVVVLNNALQV